MNDTIKKAAKVLAQNGNKELAKKLTQKTTAEVDERKLNRARKKLKGELDDLNSVLENEPEDTDTIEDSLQLVLEGLENIAEATGATFNP